MEMSKSNESDQESEQEQDLELGKDESKISRANSWQHTATTLTVDAKIIDEPITMEIPVGRSIPNGKGKVLYRAALRGDWKTAKALFLERNIASIPVTEREDTALHIAAATKQTVFVYKLVEILDNDYLTFRNIHGNTAFCLAAVSGVVKIAEIMYKKNHNLPAIRGSSMMTPFEMAVLMGNKEMAHYLYKISPLGDCNADERLRILEATIQFDMCDIALKIFKADKSIITSHNLKKGGRVLLALAQKPLSKFGGTSHGWILERLLRIASLVPCFESTFGALQMRRQAGELLKELWEQILTLPDSKISKLFEKTPILNDAVKIGNVEFLTLLTQSYPDLIWKVDSSNRYSIFHVAVIYRQEKVFSLIYDMGAIKDLLTLYKDPFGNNILHLAGKLPPQSRRNAVSGAALQMQRDLLWFKEVEKIVSLSQVEMKNFDEDGRRRTPQELFIEEHEELRKAGEEWMKHTSGSCMVAATLIATVALAAAFTVPGGNNGATGAPIFLKDRWFTVFVISNAVAMFSSTTSMMMFLSILTSRYPQDDFLFKLPAKLMAGLFTLFVSIGCMGLTFGGAFFLAYKEENQGKLPILVAALACLPIIIYAMLNWNLWIALICSTCLPSRFMFRPGKHRLF